MTGAFFADGEGWGGGGGSEGRGQVYELMVSMYVGSCICTAEVQNFRII